MNSISNSNPPDPVYGPDKARLEEIRDYILTHPKDLDMSTYCSTHGGCIVGMAVMFESGLQSMQELYNHAGRPFQILKERFQSAMIADLGRKILKVNNTQLFFLTSWPPALTGKYLSARTAKGRAKVTADAINRYIETNYDFNESHCD